MLEAIDPTGHSPPKNSPALEQSPHPRCDVTKRALCQANTTIRRQKPPSTYDFQRWGTKETYLKPHEIKSLWSGSFSLIYELSSLPGVIKERNFSMDKYELSAFHRTGCSFNHVVYICYANTQIDR